MTERASCPGTHSTAVVFTSFALIGPEDSISVSCDGFFRGVAVGGALVKIGWEAFLQRRPAGLIFNLGSHFRPSGAGCLGSLLQ